jgi:predicted AlkP superfamily phosphohydrolase/phosphomutase
VDTATAPSQLMMHLAPIRWTVAGDLTFARLAERLYRERKPDFFTVYLRGMDTLAHHYWNFHAPEAIPQVEVDPELSRYLGGTMRAYYKYVDDLLGPILAQADARTTILVVSDHGFKGGLERGIAMHNLDGVFMMSGLHAGKGEIQGASVYDIMPTMLVLMGLPPAEDMPGKVLWAALDGSISQERFTKRLPTYETGDRVGTSPVESPVDEEIKERLKSLGYID